MAVIFSIYNKKYSYKLLLFLLFLYEEKKIDIEMYTQSEYENEEKTNKINKCCKIQSKRVCGCVCVWPEPETEMSIENGVPKAVKLHDK